MEIPSSEPGAKNVNSVVDHLFRHESGKMISTLTRIFGFRNIDLAEDVVQEALTKALHTWAYGGVPENPAGWIMQVARNLAIDHLRREKNFTSNKAPLLYSRSVADQLENVNATVFLENEVRDDQLRMIFTCCHPVLTIEARITLTLKTLCGFSTEEIARAFLSQEASIAKRITRAKHRIREARVPFDVPVGRELNGRLDAVLKVLYLMFNEGYNTSRGQDLIRQDLCEEAIRLTLLLVEHPAGNFPKTRALLALMLFHGARLSGRIASDGNLLLLSEQDRSSWNRLMIGKGFDYLSASAAGNVLSEYHLEAGIAACHCMAPDYESTDWRQILALYDSLIDINHSPVVKLNRAVALAKVQGPQTGLDALQPLIGLKAMESYYLLYAILGEFHLQLNKPAAAAEYFAKALELTNVGAEKGFLERKLAACRGPEPWAGNREAR